MSDLAQELADISAYLKDQYECTPDEWPAVIAKGAAELRRLQAIVDKLPKTADGVPVTPGRNTELFSHTWMGEVIAGPPSTPGYFNHSPESWFTDCYSTREAAEAARGDA